MAEPPAGPPPGWTTPDEPEPEPGSRATFPPAEVLPGRQPQGWGQPPAHQSGWGAPPAAPTTPAGAPQWGSGAPQWGGGAPQWGGAAPQWGSGGPAEQWRTPSRPGIIPLRPLAVGEILDGAFRAIRSNPPTMAGFSAIVIAVMALLSTLPQAWLLTTLAHTGLTDPTRPRSLESTDVASLIGAGSLTALIAILQFVVATTIVSALLIVAVDGAVRGVSMRPGQLWKRVRPRVFAVLGLALTMLFVLPMLFLVALIPGLIVVLLPGGTALNVIGVLLMVLGGFVGVAAVVTFYFGFWAVAAPALLLENLGVVAALTRSYRLVRGNFWRVLGIGLLTALITAIMRQVLTVPFSLIGGLLSLTQPEGGFTATLLQLLVTDIGLILAGAILYPFTAAVSALLYLDLRMRREGLDVDLIRR